jgi:hypothetical protein
MKLVIIIFTFIIGLFFDQEIDFWGQFLTNIGIWLFFLILLKQQTISLQQTNLVACLIYATVGELFLSLGWGLYEYRLHNVPLFVPPGHVLLFTLGLLTSPKLPTWIIWVVPTLTTPYVIFATWQGFDTMGGVLFLMFLACLVFGTEKKLYATMFILSLLLEIYGTWIGNWVWSEQVPWLPLTSTNPPLCAGTFYCVLDLLVVSTINQVAGKFQK